MSEQAELLRLWHSRALIGREVYCGAENAIVHHLYDDVEGGVYLDRKIEGFSSWNISELSLSPDPQEASRT